MGQSVTVNGRLAGHDIGIPLHSLPPLPNQLIFAMRWFHLIFHWISSTFVALCAALARPFKAGSPTVPILPVVSQAVPTTPSFIQHYEPTFPEDPSKCICYLSNVHILTMI